jgi:hypothetical protein
MKGPQTPWNPVVTPSWQLTEKALRQTWIMLTKKVVFSGMKQLFVKWLIGLGFS